MRDDCESGRQAGLVVSAGQRAVVNDIFVLRQQSSKNNAYVDILNVLVRRSMKKKRPWWDWWDCLVLLSWMNGDGLAIVNTQLRKFYIECVLGCAKKRPHQAPPPSQPHHQRSKSFHHPLTLSLAAIPYELESVPSKRTNFEKLMCSNTVR